MRILQHDMPILVLIYAFTKCQNISNHSEVMAHTRIRLRNSFVCVFCVWEGVEVG